MDLPASACRPDGEDIEAEAEAGVDEVHGADVAGGVHEGVKEAAAAHAGLYAALAEGIGLEGVGLGGLDAEGEIALDVIDAPATNAHGADDEGEDEESGGGEGQFGEKAEGCGGGFGFAAAEEDFDGQEDDAGCDECEEDGGAQQVQEVQDAAECDPEGDAEDAGDGQRGATEA